MTYLLDVIDTPAGQVAAVTDGDSVVALSILDTPPQIFVEHFARDFGVVPAEDLGSAESIAHQLAEYFAGTRKSFDANIDYRFATGFAREALEQIALIPYGETASYAEIAERAGRPRAHRAVGTACRVTPLSLIVPVHRVIRSDGTPGEFGARPELKRDLLRHEAFVAAGTVSMVWLT